MSDPITTIITTAVEHAHSAVAVAATLKAAKDFLAKVTGPAVEELGEIGRDYVKGWRAKNGSQTLAGAGKLLAEAGREPQEVPLKTLLPLLDSASLEDEPSMADLWNALLANAADPAQRVAVQPGFAEVLRQLTPLDTILLNALYRPAGESIYSFLAENSYPQEYFVKLAGRPALVSMDNLLRLRLAKPDPNPWGDISQALRRMAQERRIMTTWFGVEFMKAVTPPTP